VPATCGTQPSWKRLGTSGFKDKSRDGSPEGLTAVQLKSGLGGKAKIAAKRKGTSLVLPALPLGGLGALRFRKDFWGHDRPIRGRRRDGGG
jgi:hypothetical protein